MIYPRIIPVLLLENGALVKTVRFRRPKYVGDPINAARIFSQKEVDELLILDIGASRQDKVDVELVREISGECFMPVSYGGGINSEKDAEEIFAAGVEKVCINTAAYKDSRLVSRLVEKYGSQSIVASVDVYRDWRDKLLLFSHSGRKREKVGLGSHLQKLIALGIGEILVQAIHRDGTWAGFDDDLIRQVVDLVSVPVIAAGGAGCGAHVRSAVLGAGASAVGLGSMSVFQKQGGGILIGFPALSERKEWLAAN